MYSSSEHPYSFVNLDFFLVQTPGPIGKLPICMCIYICINKMHMYINKVHMFHSYILLNNSDNYNSDNSGLSIIIRRQFQRKDATERILAKMM